MATIKKRAPRRVRRLGRRFSIAVGERTSSARLTPSFVLAGAQRCGTTSLFRALMAHPAVLPAVHHKGVNYFDVNYSAGWPLYQGHFPMRTRAALRARRAGEDVVTFDASGYYMYHPHAPSRLGRDLPEVKVLLLLRDPVERAFSAYKHEYARGFETESFEKALDVEDERVQPELEKMLADPSYYSFSHRHHSYRRRGQYAEQIEALSAAVGPERVLTIESSAFFAQPEEQYERIVAFLGLRPFQPASFDRWNARPGAAIPKQVRRRLDDALQPHDEALTSLLGQVPSWRR